MTSAIDTAHIVIVVKRVVNNTGRCQGHAEGSAVRGNILGFQGNLPDMVSEGNHNANIGAGMSRWTCVK